MTAIPITQVNYIAPKVCPELTKVPTAADREATYRAALELVARIDKDLTRGTRHYRNKGGGLLTSLDEVVRTMLADEFVA